MQQYEAPECRTIVLDYEGVICSSDRTFYPEGAGQYDDIFDNGSY